MTEANPDVEHRLRLALHALVLATAGTAQSPATATPGQSASAPTGDRVPSAAPHSPGAPGKLQIRPADSAAWEARLEDVDKVLVATAAELWRWFPDRDLDPIVVEPQGGPIVLFRRDAKGEYRVRLATGKTYWAQYAFQFAHEFCHILCGYRDADGQNRWFEESLCELASLFVLRRMSETWRTAPPYPNWKSFAPKLADYAEQRMKDARLPAGTSLADWYRQHALELCGNAALRDKNLVIATALLPLFEKEPARWQAVTWLNTGDPTPGRDFTAYLSAWHEHVPAEHKPFVRRLARELGVEVASKAR